MTKTGTLVSSLAGAGSGPGHQRAGEAGRRAGCDGILNAGGQRAAMRGGNGPGRRGSRADRGARAGPGGEGEAVPLALYYKYWKILIYAYICLYFVQYIKCLHIPCGLV